MAWPGRRVEYLALLLLSVFVAYIGIAMSAPSILTPARQPDAFRAIAADAWLVDGSSVKVPKVVPYFSTLRLRLDPWRPGTVTPAHLTMEWCVSGSRDFLVLPEGGEQRIRLDASCLAVPEVRFRVHNPTRAGPSDSRGVGVRLEEVQLESSFGFPLLLAMPQVYCAVLVFAVLLSLHRLCAHRSSKLRTLVVLLGAAMLGVLLSFSQEGNRIELLILLGCILLLTLGMQLACSTNREQTDVSRRSCRLALTAVVVLAALLRFYHIDFGLPAPYHPDELTKVEVIRSMELRDSLNPQYFLHPSLLLYASFGMHQLIAPWLSLGGLEAEILFSGRMVSALAGTLAIPLLFAIGAVMHSRRLGLAAAALLAVFPLHITCSRYMKEDALLVACLLLAFLTCLRAAQSGSLKWYIAAAATAGLCAGAKYTGVLALAFIAAIPWLRSGNWFPERRSLLLLPLCCLVFAPLAFLLTTPYALLDRVAFLKGIAFETQHMLEGHNWSIDPWSQLWMYHVRRSFVPGMSLLPSIAGILAVGFALYRRKIPWLVVLAAALLFFIPAEWVRAKPQPQPDRYILPCLPFLALLIAWMLERLPRRSWYLASLVLLCVLPLARSLQLAAGLADDTREQMARWIREEIPPGSRIAIDGGYYAPAFLEREYEVLPLHAATRPWEYRPDRLARNGVEYVLLSSLSYERYFSQPYAPELFRSIYERLFTKLPLEKEISPVYETYGFHNPRLKLLRIPQTTRARLVEPRAARHVKVPHTAEE